MGIVLHALAACPRCEHGRISRCEHGRQSVSGLAAALPDLHYVDAIDG